MAGRQTKRELLGQINALQREAARQAQLRQAREETLRDEVQKERTMRIAAQRGLVPYVRSLEEFDHWLREQPELCKQLQPILEELGLWEIKLGYDPDKDLSLSAVSPHRTDIL